MRHSVASVPFLNAKPLVWAIENDDQFSIDVDYLWPSKLPALLDNGLAEAVLVSSIDALTQPGRAIAGGCSISSRDRVMSVKVFSKTPLDRIKTLALDASSMTSNGLAQIVLGRMFGCRPECRPLDPDGAAMLKENDACVLIGDKGLTFEGEGLYSLDLGEAWRNLTGLPFVWACWVGKFDLSPELVGQLVVARESGERNLAAVAAEAPDDIPPRLAHEYLTTVFDYSLGPDQLSALALFGEWAFEDGLFERVYDIKVIEPAYPRLGASLV